MCQPALVILDSSGEVVYWWSWSRLASGVLAEDGIIPNAKRGTDNVDGNTHDVRWRPVPQDILDKLTCGMDLSTIRVENLGFPHGRDHINTKMSLHKNPADTARLQLRVERETGKPAALFDDGLKGPHREGKL